MSDTATAAGDTESVSDPADVEAISSGSDGDGADTSDQEGTGADETSASDTTTDDASEDDILIKHLASGKLDELDANGKKKAVPKAKPEEKPVDEAEEPAETTETEEPEGAKKPEETKDPELSEDDAKELESLKPKNARERRKFASVLKDRAVGRQAQKFADDLLAHAKESGLQSTKDIHARFEEEKYLNSITPEKRAEYYRKLADEIHPAPKPVEIPEDMQGAIDAGYMTKEEAESVARMRAEKANPKEVKATQVQPPAPTGPTEEAKTAGYQGITAIAKDYEKRYGAEWSTLAKEVADKLDPLLKKSDPSAWPELSRMVIDGIVSKRATPLKKPTQTTRPAQAPPKKSSALMTEEEEIEALAKGRPL